MHLVVVIRNGCHGKASDLAACKNRCKSDSSCTFITFWSDNGCQTFKTCTEGTHTWTPDSAVYNVKPSLGAGSGLGLGADSGGSSAGLGAGSVEVIVLVNLVVLAALAAAGMWLYKRKTSSNPAAATSDEIGTKEQEND